MSASALGASQAIQYLPAGSMVDYAGTSAPAGWLMCDGRSLPTATYPDLFTAIGYAYGGSGANFNLPDYRGRFARYNDNMGTGAASRDTGRVHGSSQDQATAKNGLQVSGGTASLTGTTSFAPAGHQHQLLTSGADNLTVQALTAGGVNRAVQTVIAPSSDLRATTNSSGSATVGLSSTAASINNGDSETRPINLSSNRIIKY